MLVVSFSQIINLTVLQVICVHILTYMKALQHDFGLGKTQIFSMSKLSILTKENIDTSWKIRIKMKEN